MHHHGSRYTRHSIQAVVQYYNNHSVGMLVVLALPDMAISPVPCQLLVTVLVFV